MKIEALRYPHERRHFDRALSFFDNNVQKIVEFAIAREYAEWLDGAESGRGGLSRPGRSDGGLAAVFRDVSEAIGPGRPVELFVADKVAWIARSMMTAAEDGPGAIILSRRACSRLGKAELAFALGHELGHLALGHGRLHGLVETVYREGKGMPPLIHREFRIWSILAECSCDRIGAEIAGGPEAASATLRRLEPRDEGALDARRLALEGSEGFERAYRTLLEGGPPTNHGAYRDFLIAAGVLVARADGGASGAERAYIANRLSRVLYVGPEEERRIATMGAAAAEAAVSAAARELTSSMPDHVEEAFLDLAVIALRDGRLSDREYGRLRAIGAESLGLSPASMNELFLRVIRSGYYRPYSGA